MMQIPQAPLGQSPSRAAAQPAQGAPQLAALNAFERAAHHLSFRRAAMDLCLSPSAVSHQIRGLEDYLGTRLFIREARPMALTEEGKRYQTAVAAGLSILGEASRDLLRRRREDTPDLQVSAVPFFSQTMILPFLADFRRRRPGTKVHVDSSSAYADVAGGGADVTIRLGRENSAGLRLDPLLDVFRMPVAAPSLVRRGLERPADLAAHTLIHIRCYPDAWAQWFAAAGESASSSAGEIWVDCGTAAIEAAEHGLGVALPLFPLTRLRPGFGEKVVAPFDIRSPSETFYFVTRREHANERRIDGFRAWMFETVRRVTEPDELQALAS